MYFYVNSLDNTDTRSNLAEWFSFEQDNDSMKRNTQWSLKTWKSLVNFCQSSYVLREVGDFVIIDLPIRAILWLQRYCYFWYKFMLIIIRQECEWICVCVKKTQILE